MLQSLREHCAAVICALAISVVAPAIAVANDQPNLNSCYSDAMIVFDASGSMGTSDYTLKVPRIASAKNAMARVVPDMAKLRRLGLIVYGEGEYNNCDSVELRLKPTADAATTLLNEIATINPRGRTPLTESVKQAADVLDYTQREGIIVLLTDGEETCGGDPCKLAAELRKKSKDLTIHVIGYRHGPAGFFTSRCMADITGGHYVSATNEKELVEALRKTLGCPFLTQQTPNWQKQTLLASARTHHLAICPQQ